MSPRGSVALPPLALAAVLAVAGLAGCAGGTDPEPSMPATDREPAAAPPESGSPAPTVQPSGPFPVARVTLRPSAGHPVPVAVHVADQPRTRRRGLMEREDVPPGTGMLFLWPEDNRGAFWMKDTPVPLSIAFADAGGEILRILDMEPCQADPCPRYDPEVPYRFALEVPRGDFDRWGVREGDLLAVPVDLTDGEAGNGDG